MFYQQYNKNKSIKKESIFKINLQFTFIFLVMFGVQTSADAQTVRQLLDSTFMHGQRTAAEMAFNDDSLREPSSREYVDLGITGTNLRACQLTPLDGLYCLDGKIVRNWPTPTFREDIAGALGVASFKVLDCGDPALGLDTRKDDTCTGMTVDFDGSIWLAGKNKGKTHSLIKVVPAVIAEAVPTCPEDGQSGTPLGLLTPGQSGFFCAFEHATGRPLLVDIAPVDGKLAEGFSLPGFPAPLEAIMGLEERKAAVAYLETGEVVEFAGGKQFWGLAGPEQLTGITLLQILDAGAAQNIVLAATSYGRILAYDTMGSSPAFQAFDIAGSREPGSTQCNFDAAVYTVRASRRTNVVFATDSLYCEVLALESRLVDGKFVGLVNVREGDQNLTLSTRGTDASPYAVPIGVTVSAGNSVNLKACGVGQTCNLVPGATLSNVQLAADSRSGLTLFQVQGIPDCRYVPFKCIAILGIDLPQAADAQTATTNAVEALRDRQIIKPMPGAAPGDPAAQLLNLTPLMPAEITDLFPDRMPDLWLPHYMRGQESRTNRTEYPDEFADENFVFGGFFARTQDGVVFRGNFETIFKVDILAGASLGCDFLPEDPLGWDVAGTVSERYATSGETDDPQHIATITNSGCGSLKSLDDRWSFKPYNLEVTPCTFNANASDTWIGQGSCVARDAEMNGDDEPDDAVYAKLLHVLVDELQQTVNELACADKFNENGGIAPLQTADCQIVQNKVLNTVDKFEKCWDAALQPKQSAGDQNCQAFDSQLESLYDELGYILYDEFGQLKYQGSDAANRIGELRSRTVRMRHILETRFLPSLPDEGFDDLQTPTQ